MIAGRPAWQPGLSAGWYGKMPGTGDFIARRLPASFSEPWDRWLQAAMAGSRERLGRRWRDAFLSMPAWRFVLAPELVSSNAWAGLMVPSVDAVGRYFPLTVASALPSAGVDLVGTLQSAARWFDEIEAIALSALAPGADAADIDAAILRRPFRTDWLDAVPDGDATIPGQAAIPQLWVATDGGAPCAAWLAEESEVFGRSMLLSERLPGSAQYCAMMDGHWLEHGWSRP